MNIEHVMDMSLGEWSAIAAFANRNNGSAQMRPPSEDEFEAAVLAARGIPVH